MAKRDLSMSKAERKWIKRKINRLLEEFDDKNRHQIRARLEHIGKLADPRPIEKRKKHGNT